MSLPALGLARAVCRFVFRPRILYSLALGEPFVPKKRGMRIVSGLLQALAAIVLVAAVLLLVFDPRIRDLVVEDASALNPLAQISGGGESTVAAQGPSQFGKGKQGQPSYTESGHAVASGCALWTVEGLDLYYSPVDPSTICVQAPGNPTEAGTRLPLGAEAPPNCDVSPDSVVYCIVGDRLTAETLKAFFDRGELQAPHVPRGDAG